MQKTAHQSPSVEQVTLQPTSSRGKMKAAKMNEMVVETSSTESGMRNLKITETVPTETAMQRYKRLRYQASQSSNSPSLASPHQSPTSRASPLRCYRLNLERPFDIHVEQSPLEYGDYMKIWNEEDYPTTVGPTEYVPPRHLGGTEGVWRTLMRWSRLAEDRVCAGTGRAEDVDERVGEAEGTSARAGDDESAGADADSSTELVVVSEESIARASWRILTPEEELNHQQLGEVDEGGEYTFRAYDWSHVIKRRGDQKKGGEDSEDEVHDADAPTPRSSPCNSTGAAGKPSPFKERISGPGSLYILATQSTGSEFDRLSPKTSEEMADETARLFRRSELSLREKAEDEEKRAEEERRREEERRKEEEARAKLERRSSSAGLSSSGRKKLSGKKILRSFSSIGNKLIDMNSSSHSTTSYRHRHSGCQNPKFAKKSSRQASAIERARDLIDNEEGESNSQAENKKPQNLSVQFYGEYSTLNDLVNDGAKRLSRSKHKSDLELLMQNDPAPPPDRWVRATGWGRCNPSSLYAAELPEGYDLDSYGKNLVIVPDSSSKGTGEPTRASSQKEEHNHKDCSTQSTAAGSHSYSEDFESTTMRQQKRFQHSPNPAGHSYEEKAPSSPVPQVKTLPTESCGTPQAQGGEESVTSLVAKQKSGKKTIGRRISAMMGNRR